VPKHKPHKKQVISAFNFSNLFYTEQYRPAAHAKMKSVKKIGKQRLQKIHQNCYVLLWACEDIELLEPIKLPLGIMLEACNTLLQQSKSLDKSEFAETTLHSGALQILNEIAELDLISLIEERLFTAQSPDGNAPTNLFFQQLLNKLEKLHQELLDNIQQLNITLTQHQ
jgi:hypothetical protein